MSGPAAAVAEEWPEPSNEQDAVRGKAFVLHVRPPAVESHDVSYSDDPVKRQLQRTEELMEQHEARRKENCRLRFRMEQDWFRTPVGARNVKNFRKALETEIERNVPLN